MTQDPTQTRNERDNRRELFRISRSRHCELKAKEKSKMRQSNNESTLIQLNNRTYHQLSIRKINTINTTLRHSFRLKNENIRLFQTAKNPKSELEFKSLHGFDGIIQSGSAMMNASLTRVRPWIFATTFKTFRTFQNQEFSFETSPRCCVIPSAGPR